MKKRIYSLSVSVNGVRPAAITYDKLLECYVVTSPAHAGSVLSPDAVHALFPTIPQCLTYCEYLVTFLDSDYQADVPKLLLCSICWEIVDTVSGLIECFYDSTNTAKFARVIVPELNVNEQFDSLDAAQVFLCYLQSPLCIKLDTEANQKS